MKLGVFMMPLHMPGRDLGTVLQEDQDLVVTCDALGYAEAWMGEHYTSTGEPVTSPLLFNASLIARTSTIRFGTGVISLPQQHPLVVAGHAALFDQLSGGRLILGVGSGGLSSDWEAFGNLDGAARARAMVESIKLIQRIWTEDPPLSHDGEFWQMKMEDRVLPELGIGRFIRPLQQPHPPIAVSIRSANSKTAFFAGKFGWIPISGNFVETEVIATQWPTYAEGAASAGQKANPASWRVGRSVLITDSDDQAAEILEDPDGVFGDYYTYLNVHRKMAMETLDIAAIDWAAERAEAVEMTKRLVIAGTRNTVLDKLVAFVDTVGPFGTLLLTGHDQAEHATLWERTFRLMAEDIGPALGRHMGLEEESPAA